MKELRISKDLTLPLEVVTQAIGILAKRRAGKSYLARRFVEQLFAAQQQVVVVDPKGDWWGARSSADGKSSGLPIVIFGGERGDVPLEAGSGALVARVVVEERVSALLDLSLLRKHEVVKFMTPFLEDLYRLKAHEQNRTPLMLAIDEADAIAPQKPQAEEARMLGAAQDIVRRGGQRGLGCIMITQRSAVLSKDVLTQVEMLIALRTIAPQDLAAIKAWIDVHGTPEGQKTLMASLPSLPIGDAWYWSPGWPTDKGIFKRAHTLPIETFDSGATPKPGQKRVEPKRLADVDLDAIREQMAETIERAKADDPKALRARIAELEKAARAAANGKPAKNGSQPVPAGPRREDLAIIHALRKALEKAMKIIVQINAEDFLKAEGVDAGEVQKAIDAATQRITTLLERKLDERSQRVEKLRREAAAVLASLKALLDSDVAVDVTVARVAPVPASFSVKDDAKSRKTSAPPRRATAGTGDESLTPIERALLHAIVQHDRLSLKQAAIIAGYSTNSGSTAAAAGKLRATGLVEGGNDGMRATEAGIDAAGEVPALPSGPELAELWYRKLAPIEAAILKAAVDAHPDPVSLRDAAEGAGYSTNSGSTAAAAGKLRTLALVTGGNAGMTANERLV